MMRVFEKLRILMLSIASSVGALGWSIVFLSLLQIMASVGMTQVVHSHKDAPTPYLLGDVLKDDRSGASRHPASTRVRHNHVAGC